jgi:hypothetical protein
VELGNTPGFWPYPSARFSSQSLEKGATAWEKEMLELRRHIARTGAETADASVEVAGELGSNLGRLLFQAATMRARQTANNHLRFTGR